MSLNNPFTSTLLITIVCCFLFDQCYGTRKLNSLYEPPQIKLNYHNGPLLSGQLPVSILWYGKFTPSQKSIISDFSLSLNPTEKQSQTTYPSVSRWWLTIQAYMERAGKKNSQIVLTGQVSDDQYSIGKLLKRSQISDLAQQSATKDGAGVLTVVLTADDVAVEGFCMSNCGFHGSDPKSKTAYIWVGNSMTQCPGQCAWPFHQPIYGPQGLPLGAPNGDVGADGMVVNIAGLLVNTVTNPFGDGFYQAQESLDGPKLEVASACTGVYGKGAYPGYAGELLKDPGSGGSYNALGVSGRKYLLPALFDATASKCLTSIVECRRQSRSVGT